MGGTLTKVDIGHGRGWLAPAPAASLRRIDAQLGRLADINEAGRSPEQADENRRRWLAYERYLKGGPWAPKAPYALGSDQSVHCRGYAADSDDWYNAAAAAVWRDNGWRQTARYPGNKAKDEPWHGEYFEHLDNHRFASAPAGGASSTPASRPVLSEEDEMPDSMFAVVDGVPSWCWLNWGNGALLAVHTQAEADWIGSYMGSIKQDLRQALVNGKKVTDGGGELYKNKLAMFGLLCPKPTIQRGGLSDEDFARLEAMITAGVKDALTGVA